jgi:hypothetical protein
MLAKMKVRDDNKCTFCSDVVDFIEHFFVECPKVSYFWKFIENLILKNTGVHIKLGVPEVLFGVKNSPETIGHVNTINHIIGIGKVCISIYKKRNAPYPLEIIFQQQSLIRKIN